MGECLYGNGDECENKPLRGRAFCHEHLPIDGEQAGGGYVDTGQTETETLRRRMDVLEHIVEQLARTVAAHGGDHGN